MGRADWEEAADHDASSAQSKGMKLSSRVKGKFVIQLYVYVVA